MASNIKFNVYYSINENGPWTLANETPIDRVESGNSYTISGLSRETQYYFVIVGGTVEDGIFQPLISQSIGPKASGAGDVSVATPSPVRARTFTPVVNATATLGHEFILPPEIASVQTKNNGTSGSVNTSVAVTLDSAPTDGNFLIMAIAIDDTTDITSIVQSGVTWTRAVKSAANASTNATAEIWYAENVSSAGTTITVNLNSSTNAAIYVQEFSGIKASGSLDKTASANTDDEDNRVYTGVTDTTTVAKELWWGFVYNNYLGGSIVSSGWTSDFKISQVTGGYDTIVIGWKVVNATGEASFITTDNDGITILGNGCMTTWKRIGG